jgi:hypothetical protein
MWLPQQPQRISRRLLPIPDTFGIGGRHHRGLLGGSNGDEEIKEEGWQYT